MFTHRVSFQQDNVEKLTPYTKDELNEIWHSQEDIKLDLNRVEDTLLRNLLHQRQELDYRINKQLEKLWKRKQ
jgi:hypothetical protein